MTTKEEYKYEQVAGHEAVYDAENGNIVVQTPVTTMATVQKSSNRKFLYVAACVGNLAAFVCGTAFGWTSPVIPKLKSNSTDENPLDLPITAGEESWIGSLLPVGAILGPFAGGFGADKIGRKFTLLAGTVPFALAFLMAAFASNSLVFFAMRFLCGLGTGIIFTVLPMYIGEIAEDEVRGSLGSFMQLFITFGLLFSYAIGPYISVPLFNFACLVTPCVFIVIFYMFIPESPYYLIRSDQTRAEEALMKLRTKSRNEIQKELSDIKAVIDESVANKGNFMDIFKSRGLTKALILSLSLVTFQQFAGINVVLFYAQNIFLSAGSTISPEICTIILGIVQVLSSAVTPLVVERQGKRFLLMLSAIGMGIALAILAYFFYLKSHDHDVSSISWLPVGSLIIYMIVYCVGFGPLPWAVMGELFPDNIKSAASTATAVCCWFFGFLLTKYFSLVSDQIGESGSFGLFAVCCLVAGGFVYKFLPETSGKSLQEIQDILNS